MQARRLLLLVAAGVSHRCGTDGPCSSAASAPPPHHSCPSGVAQQHQVLPAQNNSSSSINCRRRRVLPLAWAVHSLRAGREWAAQQQQQQQCLVLFILRAVQMQAAASRLHGNTAR